MRQLTASSADGPVLNSITLSPDGKHLAYLDSAKGISLLQIDTGENRSLPDTTSFWPNSWLPDGDHLFVSKLGTLWNLEDVYLEWDSPKVSRSNPTRSLTQWSAPAFKNDKGEIWVTDAAGESPKKVVSTESPWMLQNFTWSPTGRRIAYDKWTVVQADRYADRYRAMIDVSLDSCDLDGRCSTILSNSKLRLPWGGECAALVWLPDGRIVFTLAELPPNDYDSNLWSLAVDPNTGRPQGEPKRLTSWTGSAKKLLQPCRGRKTSRLSASASRKHRQDCRDTS